MIKAKKSLGQNFLKSKKIAEEIADAADLKKSDVVIEIGPGKGMLTDFLLEKTGKVIAVEKDHRLIEHLKEKYKNQNIEIVEGDILELKIESLLSDSSYKLVANIPYYITGNVLRKFLTAKIQPETIILMVQKEVGERIMARDGKESLLSMSVKVYGEPTIVRKVSKEFFNPKPKVDSVILKISNISRAFFEDIDEDSFFKLLKLGFGHKRKTLLNNIKKYDQKLSVKLRECGLESKIRAEKLSPDDWKCFLR